MVIDLLNRILSDIVFISTASLSIYKFVKRFTDVIDFLLKIYHEAFGVLHDRFSSIILCVLSLLTHVKGFFTELIQDLAKTVCFGVLDVQKFVVFFALFDRIMLYFVVGLLGNRYGVLYISVKLVE